MFVCDVHDNFNIFFMIKTARQHVRYHIARRLLPQPIYFYFYSMHAHSPMAYVCVFIVCSKMAGKINQIIIAIIYAFPPKSERSQNIFLFTFLNASVDIAQLSLDGNDVTQCKVAGGFWFHCSASKVSNLFVCQLSAGD
jgi:hypothetical protein